jgi:hypothetical protein
LPRLAGAFFLERVEQGDAKAADELLPLVYEELRKLAAATMANEKPGRSLQPTALVHEAGCGWREKLIGIIGSISFELLRWRCTAFWSIAPGSGTPIWCEHRT